MVSLISCVNGFFNELCSIILAFLGVPLLLRFCELRGVTDTVQRQTHLEFVRAYISVYPFMTTVNQLLMAAFIVMGHLMKLE